MTPPKVFVSYSHDSLEHKRWVLEFATRLRASGIDAILDQWDLKPGDDLPHFMESHLTSSDRVLMICSERYVEKANSGTGGVGYEKMIVTADLLSEINNNKVIPIIRNNPLGSGPTFLKSKFHIDFNNTEDEEFAFDTLMRSILDAPIFEKPPIGENPYTSPSTKPKKTYDEIQEAMTVIGEIANKLDKDTIPTSSVKRALSLSKITFDVIINKLERNGYISVTFNGFNIELSMEGKLYIFENKLLAEK